MTHSRSVNEAPVSFPICGRAVVTASRSTDSMNAAAQVIARVQPARGRLRSVIGCLSVRLVSEPRTRAPTGTRHPREEKSASECGPPGPQVALFDRVADQFQGTRVRRLGAGVVTGEPVKLGPSGVERMESLQPGQLGQQF